MGICCRVYSVDLLIGNPPMGDSRSFSKLPTLASPLEQCQIFVIVIILSLGVEFCLESAHWGEKLVHLPTRMSPQGEKPHIGEGIKSIYIDSLSLVKYLFEFF